MNNTRNIILTAITTALVAFGVFKLFVSEDLQTSNWQIGYDEGYIIGSEQAKRKAKKEYDNTLSQVIEGVRRDSNNVVLLPYIQNPSFSYIKTVNPVANQFADTTNQYSVFKNAVLEIHRESFYSLTNVAALDSMKSVDLMQKVDSLSEIVSPSYYQQYVNRVRELEALDKATSSAKAQLVGDIIALEICQFVALASHEIHPILGYAGDATCTYFFGDFVDKLNEYNRLSASTFDLLSSKAALSNKIEQSIFELSTAQSVFKTYHESSFENSVSTSYYNFIMAGKVKVIFPLNKGYSVDHNMDQRKIHIVLPQPELEITDYQIEKIFIKDSKINLQRQNNAETKAKVAIIEQAAESYIVDFGRNNAIKALQDLFFTLTRVDNIEIVVSFTDQPQNEILLR